MLRRRGPLRGERRAARAVPPLNRPRTSTRLCGQVSAAVTVVGGLLFSVALGAVPARADTVNVRILNRSFVAPEVTAPMVEGEPGFPPAHAHVKWFNVDPGLEHTVTFDDPVLPSSTPLSMGQVHEAVLDRRGSFPYHCSIHPEMRGVVTVTPAPDAAERAGTGKTTPSWLPLAVAVAAAVVLATGGALWRRRRRARLA